MRTSPRIQASSVVFMISLAARAGIAPAGPDALPGPSKNAGRKGIYQCDTSNPTYKYYVCVSESYAPERPAGLYLFFHGQGGHGGAPHFGRAKAQFVDRHNIVAVNMQYTDGDNAKDTGGKVEAAVEAIRQTLADYKIVLGRGVVASFSGGGLPHAGLFERFGKGKGTYRGIAWPFSHVQLTGSNYHAKATGAAPMSWYIGVGGGEWNMAGLGASNSRRAEEVYAMIARSSYCPDAHFKIIKEKGHSIDARDIEASAYLFAQSDLFLAPFVHEPDYTERELAPVAAAANQRAFRATLSRLDSVIRSSGSDEALRAKAEALRGGIQARIAASVQSVKALLSSDPVRGTAYGRQLAIQLSGLPESRDVAAAVSAASKDRKALALIMNALPRFAAGVGDFIEGGAKLKPDAVGLLEQVRELAGDEVLISRMAGEFLLLK